MINLRDMLWIIPGGLGGNKYVKAGLDGVARLLNRFKYNIKF
jgi:hypothetical protein